MSDFRFVQGFVRDVGYAVRLFRHRPTMAVTALITIAVGIGLNATIFSVAHSILWQELSFPGSERLVYLQEVGPPPARERTRVSPANATDWDGSAKTLDGLATISPLASVLVEETRAEEIGCAAVSAAFFRILPVHPAQGRLLNDSDYASVPVDGRTREANARRLQPRVTVISDALWRGYFGGRPDIVGHEIQMRRLGTVQIVGVLGSDFDFPMFGGADCWMPDTRLADVRGTRFLMAVGRLAPDATLVDAQAEFDVIAARLAAAYPETNKGHTVSVTLLREHITASVRTQLWFLAAGAFCVLLIVCANVSNLLLANASGRRAEFGTRLALGATRWVLVRQALTESVLLATVGGLAGVLLAIWAVPWLVSGAPADLPRLHEIRIGAPVLALSVAASIGLGLIAGFMTSAGARIGRDARGWRSGAAFRGSGFRYRALLIVGEVALALMLVVAASLLVRSMRAVNALPLGFDGSNVISVALSPDSSRMRGFGGLAELAERVRGVPGVIEAGIGTPPLGSGLHEGAIARPATPSSYVPIAVKAVGPGYFEVLEMELRSGRFIDERDIRSAPTVAVLNERASRLVFPPGAVGQTLLYEGQPVEVVGVVADVRLTGLELEPDPAMFLATDQSRITFQINNIVVRTAGDPRDLLPAIRAVIRQFDPQLPLTGIETFAERLAAVTAQRRFTLWLVMLFSVAALGLAIVGIYGVIADWVVQRVPEIGIRMALGATTANVLRMVIVHAAWMTAAGVTIGVAAALALHGLMSGFVFGVATTDPASYAFAALALVGTGLGACLIPARRAARVDPAVTLRRD